MEFFQRLQNGRNLEGTLEKIQQCKQSCHTEEGGEALESLQRQTIERLQINQEFLIIDSLGVIR